jgi:hypothetical protein
MPDDVYVVGVRVILGIGLPLLIVAVPVVVARKGYSPGTMIPATLGTAMLVMAAAMLWLVVVPALAVSATMYAVYRLALPREKPTVHLVSDAARVAAWEEVDNLTRS